ncbi:FKBP-type peptidyl-prolyl cis-trans isomerase [Roseivirga pacifica]|uniref:FKBP-type peptidyl-prolyl cis-trans isomerase n=1 Tax=Roseivirga pacifica TaxID=1267423 RepID=UPI00227B734C|nr:hypothetical protein [Roseivirga pacifica]
MSRFLSELLVALVLGFGICSCQTEELVFDYKEQLELDRKIVSEYLEANDINAVESPNGLWYQVIEEGEGDLLTEGDQYLLQGQISNLDGTNISTDNNDSVSQVNFEAMSSVVSKIYLNDYTVFIQEVALLIKPGGKIRMYIPAWLAYKNKVGRFYSWSDNGSYFNVIIPPNSNLIFEGTLIMEE